MILTIRETVSRRGRFDGFVDGKQVCWSSRTPFLSAARTLLKWDIDPATILIMVHERTGTRSLRGPIGAAANLGIREDASGIRFVPYDDPRSRIEGVPKPTVVVKDATNVA
jgi:hypothetical protein